MAPGSRPCRYSASIRSSKYLHSLSLCRMSFSWSSERPTRHFSAAAFLSLTRVAISGPVQRLAGEREEGLADALGRRRMRMDQRGHFGGNRFPVHDQHALGDEVRDVRSHHVNAEHGTAGLLGDDLHHSALADDVRLPDALEIQPLDLHVVASLDRLRLGQPDGGDLRGAVRDAWDAGVLDRRNRLPADPLGHGVPLGERHVRELQRRRGDVADRPHAARGRLQLIVDLDEPPVDLDARFLQAEAFGDRSASDRHEAHVRLGGLLLAIACRERDVDAAVVFGYVLDGCAGVGRDPAFAKRAGDLLGGVLVLERCSPGRSRGVEPVARTTSVAWSVRPSTSTDGPDLSEAVPLTTSIFLAFTRPVRPDTSLSTIFAWNAWIFDQSGWPLALMPHSIDRLTVSMTDADCSSALVGMHPRSRHVPPRRWSRSTSATRLPSKANRRAQEYPPVPAPITTTS